MPVHVTLTHWLNIHLIPHSIGILVLFYKCRLYHFLLFPQKIILFWTELLLCTPINCEVSAGLRATLSTFNASYSRCCSSLLGDSCSWSRAAVISSELRKVSRVTIRAGSKHTSSQCCVCQTLHKTCYILLKYQHIYTYNWHNWLLLYAHKKILNISTQQSHGLCWLKYGTRWKYPYYQACILNECGSVFPSSCQQREDWRGWCNGSVMMFLCRLCPWSWDLPIPGQPGPGRLSPVQFPSLNNVYGDKWWVMGSLSH